MTSKIIQLLKMSPLMAVFIYLLGSVWLILSGYFVATRGLTLESLLFAGFSFAATLCVIKGIDLLFKAIRFEQKLASLLNKDAK